MQPFLANPARPCLLVARHWEVPSPILLRVLRTRLRPRFLRVRMVVRLSWLPVLGTSVCAGENFVILFSRLL